MKQADPAFGSRNRKLRCLRTFWLASLVMPAMLMVMSIARLADQADPHLGITSLAGVALALTYSALYAVGAGAALYMLPQVAASAVRRLNLASGALGLLLPFPIAAMQAAAFWSLARYAFRSQFSVVWIVPVIAIGSSLAVALVYFAAVQLLARGGLVSLRTPGLCRCCGHFLATSTTCPECGTRAGERRPDRILAQDPPEAPREFPYKGWPTE